MLKLRRPTLGDKEAILDMMVEFEQLQTAHDGGFWGKTDCDCFDYDQWLQNNLDKEMGLKLPKNFVPAIQFVSFDDSGRGIGFFHIRFLILSTCPIRLLLPLCPYSVQ